MTYWDSSALVPLFVTEVRTAQCETLLQRDSQIVTWWLSKVECASAFNRLEREGGMDEAALRVALSDLEEFWTGIAEILPVSLVRKTALRILRVHPLKSADALQLSAALLAAGDDRGSLEFISFDDQLLRAADKEGFHCIAT